MPTTRTASIPCQTGILQPVPAAGQFVFFTPTTQDAAALRQALTTLARAVDGVQTVVAIGPQLVAALGAQVPGLREFPDLSAATVDVPCTPAWLCLILHGDERGELLLRAQQFTALLQAAFTTTHVLEGFRHGQGPNGHGRDLTGYEDGTENPEGDDASAAAFVQDQGTGQDGGSFVAMQQWQHNFKAFYALSAPARDHVMGRRLSDNEELDDAPESAHVKRTAQESFTPEAFVVRRSMPWSDFQGGETRSGLMFVAYAHRLDAFEVQMRRMAGLDDGVIDGLFQISRPLTGSYLWCPPVRDGHLDLRQLGL